MSESPRSGSDWSEFDSESDDERSDRTEKDQSLLDVEQVLRSLEEIACQDYPEYKLLPEGLLGEMKRIFDPEYGKRFSTERWLDDRMKVMRALGICLKSRKMVDDLGLANGYSFSREEGYSLNGPSRLSFPELEALTQGLKHSTVLKALHFSVDLSHFVAKDENVSACWTLVTDILRSVENLEDFTIKALHRGYDYSYLGQIAQAVTCKGVRNLQRLVVAYSTVWTEEMLTHLSEILGAAPKLKYLGLQGTSMEDVGAKILGQAIALHEVLEILEFVVTKEVRDACDAGCSYATGPGSRKGVLDCLITEALLGPRPNTSIHRLRFRAPRGILPGSGPIEEISTLYTSIEETLDTFLHDDDTEVISTLDIFSHLLLKNSSVAVLEIDAFLAFYSSCGLRNLFEALGANRSIRILKLKVIDVNRSVNTTGTSTGIYFGGFTEMVDWIKSATHLEDLDLSFAGGISEDNFELDWPAFFKALASNSILRRLRLCMPTINDLARMEAIQKEAVVWLRTTRLKWLEFDGGPCLWGTLLRSLRANTNLEGLTLSSYVLSHDEEFRELMKLLQINSTLQDIRFPSWSWDDNSRQAQVDAALRCKARQETYLAELRATFGTTRWAHPTCGRVFLCGNPMAGKTQLAHTMLQQGMTPWYTRVMEKFIPRTRGIEIQLLRNDDSMQLSLWDLAGHDIFRALQEYLFPKLNKACVFLFVFSLYDREAKTIKPNLEVALEEEFLYWLKFIASNSQVTGFNLPIVMVILTHKDKTQDINNNWALHVVEKLRREFNDVLAIYPSPFLVNGRQKKDVWPIMSQVFDGFKDLFEQKLFMVPEACCQISRFLLDWSLQNDKQPVVMYEKFVDLCTAADPTLKDFLSNHSDDEKMRSIDALASYLHDVGTIIELPSQKIMVVNPNWLTHAFLGNLIGKGKDFHDQHTVSKKASPPFSSNGFLYKSQFERFVKENILPALKKDRYHELDFEMVHMLMEGLDLCFEVPNGDERSLVFVPTLFRVGQQRQLGWKRSHVKGVGSYLGLRVRCKDQRTTSMSVGFFPKFQISLWRKMIQSLSLDLKLSYDCKYNLISILHDGHDVLVENEDDGSFVDILVRSEKSRESVWMFVEKHILQELYDFCASAKGPPGVTLVVDVLRTECVRQLTKCTYRKDQAVSRELLKHNLKRSIRDQSLRERSEDDSEDLFKHTWKGLEDSNLTYECEAALDLLSPQDILEVHEWVRSETSALIDKAKRSDYVLDEFCACVGSVVTADVSKERIRMEEQTEDHMSKKHKTTSLDLRPVVNMMQDLHLKMDELHVKFDELKVDIMRVTAQFTKAQKITEDSFIRLFQQMDRLTGVTRFCSQLPRRPYFTIKDASWSHRVKAKVNVGDPLILHFLCENKNGNHIVLNQQGFELIVEDGNRKWLRVILRNSVKALWCLLKIGVHVTTSLGSVVPDLQLQVSDSKYTSLATLSISSVLDIIEPKDTNSSNVVNDENSDNSSAERAWQFLQEHLKGELMDKIPHYFSLYPACYVDTRLQNLFAHVWLCKECMEAGIKDGKIRRTSKSP